MQSKIGQRVLKNDNKLNKDLLPWIYLVYYWRTIYERGYEYNHTIITQTIHNWIYIENVKVKSDRVQSFYLFLVECNYVSKIIIQ